MTPVLRAGIVIASLVAFPAMAVAQPTPEDVSKKTADAWKTAKSYSAEKKDEAVAYGQKLVHQTDREIKALERKASKTSGEAKAQYQSDIKELKVKRKQTSKKLDEMGKATSEAWDRAKDDFADAWRDLEGSYEKAVKKLK